MATLLWGKFSNGKKYHVLNLYQWGEMDCHQGGHWPLSVFRQVSHVDECRRCHRKFCRRGKQ